MNPSNIRGRSVRVTPPCGSANGPMVLIAGGSKAAARRAGPYGLGFVSQTDLPGLKEFYEAQCRAHGHEPGIIQFPVPGTPTTVFVADDVDEAWDVLGPHLLHDAVTAASYRPHDDSVASITRADSVAALREENGPYRIFTPTRRPNTCAAGARCRCIRCAVASHPTMAWPYLERAAAAAARPTSKESASCLDCRCVSSCGPPGESGRSRSMPSAPTGSGTRWRMGAFARQGRQGRR